MSVSKPRKPALAVWMEDSFGARVEKVFGSLSAPSSTTLWTLSDEEIEKKEWGRRTGASDPDDLVPVDHLSDGEGPDELVQEIRSSVGLDCTLDYEEEEDEFDKVALGQGVEEDSCDRVYMSDMAFGYGIDAHAHTELPDSFHQVSRDPRANHSAARARLGEDAHLNLPSPILKPILKTSQSKSSKRVHFHPHSLPSPHPDHPGDPVPDDGVSPPDRLPDYLRNPTKYTRYTLDSPDHMDDASNRKAYMDLFNMLNKKPEEASQHPLTYTPIGKFHNSSLVKPSQGEAIKGKLAAVSVAATVARDDEDCVMDEVGTETALDDQDCVVGEMGMETVRKPARHYRRRTSLNSDSVDT